MQGGHLAIGSRGNELATLLAAASGVLSVSTPSEWRLSGTPWTDAHGISVRLCSVIGSLSELAGFVGCVTPGGEVTKAVAERFWVSNASRAEIGDT